MTPPIVARSIMMSTAKRVAVWLAVVMMGAVAAAGCEAGGDTVMPGELIGTWRTTAPAYADRSLHLSSTTIAFGSDDGAESAHPIRRVLHVREHGQLLYTITYTDPLDQTVSFYYDPADGGTITLKNQRKFQWKREG
jgi:hypothetical protein